jgi:hypothetical protein
LAYSNLLPFLPAELAKRDVDSTSRQSIDTSEQNGRSKSPNKARVHPSYLEDEEEGLPYAASSILWRSLKNEFYFSF